MSDWQNIEPLSEPIAIDLVIDFLADRKLVVSTIPRDNTRQGNKTPDLQISFENNPFAIGEIKTPELTLDPIFKMYLWKTTFYKIRKFVHKAYTQFEGFDKPHAIPRIIFFTSNHPQLNWTNLMHSITGVVSYGESVIRDFRDLNFLSDSNEELNQIDAIIWLQINYMKPAVFQHFEYFNHLSPFRDKLRQQLGNNRS